MAEENRDDVREGSLRHTTILQGLLFWGFVKASVTCRSLRAKREEDEFFATRVGEASVVAVDRG